MNALVALLCVALLPVSQGQFWRLAAVGRRDLNNDNSVNGAIVRDEKHEVKMGIKNARCDDGQVSEEHFCTVFRRPFRNFSS